MSEHLKVVYSVVPGEIVLTSSHPGDRTFFPFLVTGKGVDTLEGVFYAYNGDSTRSGHKGGIRHSSDPIWQDPMRVASVINEGEGGCFIRHPLTEMLTSAIERIEDLEDQLLAKNIAKPKPRKKITAPVVDEPKQVDPEFAPFREPTEKDGVELTEEMKQQRRAALAAALASAGGN